MQEVLHARLNHVGLRLLPSLVPRQRQRQVRLILSNNTMTTTIQPLQQWSYQTIQRQQQPQGQVRPILSTIQWQQHQQVWFVLSNNTTTITTTREGTAHFIKTIQRQRRWQWQRQRQVCSSYQFILPAIYSPRFLQGGKTSMQHDSWDGWELFSNNLQRSFLISFTNFSADSLCQISFRVLFW